MDNMPFAWDALSSHFTWPTQGKYQAAVPLSVFPVIVSHPPIILSNITQVLTLLGRITIYTYMFTEMPICVLSPSLYTINP